jgi:hypothetical protein
VKTVDANHCCNRTSSVQQRKGLLCGASVGCSTSAGWAPDEDGVVRAAHTDFLPAAEVERVEPNENIGDVEFGMEALAALAASGPDALRDGLRH